MHPRHAHAGPGRANGSERRPGREGRPAVLQPAQLPEHLVRLGQSVCQTPLAPLQERCLGDSAQSASRSSTGPWKPWSSTRSWQVAIAFRLRRSPFSITHGTARRRSHSAPGRVLGAPAALNRGLLLPKNRGTPPPWWRVLATRAKWTAATASPSRRSHRGTPPPRAPRSRAYRSCRRRCLARCSRPGPGPPYRAWEACPARRR